MMKRGRIVWRMLMMGICLCVLAGCWDRKELDELAFVMATGFDRMENGELESTMQIALPSKISSSGQNGSGTDSQSFMNVSATAHEAIDTLNKGQKQLSRKINLGHRRVLIIGESLGRSGIDQILDALLRSPESRFNSYIATSYGASAREILSATYQMEKIPAIGMNNLMESGFNISVKTDEFIHNLSTYGQSPVTPAIRLVKNTSDQPTFVFDKVAMYRDNKLVGYLSGEQLKAFQLFRKITRDLTWIVQFTPPKNAFHGTVNMRVTKVSTDTRTRLTDGDPAITITCRIVGKINSNDTEMDLSKPDVLAELERKFEEDIHASMERLISHTQQKDIRADILGFGDQIHIEHPYVWKKLKTQWDTLYPSVPVKVNIHVRIERIGRTKGPAQLKKS
ncbi:Ger(x)C family spore germination protein [Paenibacillus timonensis]|uniref:Ger(x)C family spore germination protein n=1 Tax=Paenibacillus timonensis TaxID=225915 RepID=UPI003F94641F